MIDWKRYLWSYNQQKSQFDFEDEEKPMFLESDPMCDVDHSYFEENSQQKLDDLFEELA